MIRYFYHKIEIIRVFYLRHPAVSYKSYYSYCMSSTQLIVLYQKMWLHVSIGHGHPQTTRAHETDITIADFMLGQN